MAKKASKPVIGPIESILGVAPTAAAEALATLTERESEVAELMAQGIKNRQIAEQLGISVKTLDVHRTNVKWKLKSRTAVDVARYVFARKFSKHLR